MVNSRLLAKPFLKWAGGKGQLLEQIKNFFPQELSEGKITRYIEPFLGGGAVFFYLAQTYPFSEIILIDINPELVLAYQVIQRDVNILIECLGKMQDEYLPLEQKGREKYYYQIREIFNQELKSLDFCVYSFEWIPRAAQIIFLNRTCFNGLFRVNSQGKFNVPMGKYKQPLICNSENLRLVSELLQRAEIYLGSYNQCQAWADKSTFVYFDPPYRPLNITSSFTSYSQHNFNDEEQIKLASFYDLLDKQGVKLMLSNSDPKNQNPNDDFFDDFYKKYHIHRLQASRAINSKAEKRGLIQEILVINYYP
jgi:DNA adenine methylase